MGPCLVRPIKSGGLWLAWKGIGPPCVASNHDPARARLAGRIVPSANCPQGVRLPVQAYLSIPAVNAMEDRQPRHEVSSPAVRFTSHLEHQPSPVLIGQRKQYSPAHAKSSAQGAAESLIRGYPASKQGSVCDVDSCRHLSCLQKTAIQRINSTTIGRLPNPIQQLSSLGGGIFKISSHRFREPFRRNVRSSHFRSLFELWTCACSSDAKST
jgi:hypothetical protein